MRTVLVFSAWPHCIVLTQEACAVDGIGAYETRTPDASHEGFASAA